MHGFLAMGDGPDPAEDCEFSSIHMNGSAIIWKLGGNEEGREMKRQDTNVGMCVAFSRHTDDELES